MVHGAPGAGGVATVVRSLTAGLLHKGWHVTHAPASPMRWRTLLAMAKDSQVLLATHNFRAAYVAWLVGAVLRKPVVVWVHGPLNEVLEEAKASQLKRRWLRLFYQRRALHFAFVSDASRQSFNRFLGAQHPPKPGHQSIIANAVEPHTKPPQPTSRESQDDRVRIGYVGRLSPEKDPHLLIDLMHALPPQFHLTVLGDGPMRQELQAAAAPLIAEGRITWMGHRPDSAGFYATQDLTVLTSRYEGCPMAALESLAAGVPCFGVPIPALQEMFQHDAPYLLARDRTARALAEAIQAGLERPRALVQRDLNAVLTHYRHSDFVERWHQLLAQAAAPW